MTTGEVLQNGQRVCRLVEECLGGAQRLQGYETAGLATLHRSRIGVVPQSSLGVWSDANENRGRAFRTL